MTGQDYLVHARLGSGSTGANFRVSRRHDGRQLVLKVLHADVVQGVDLEHLKQAIAAISEVEHPVVATEMQLFKWRGDLVLTRQFYQGVDLGTLVGSSAMAPRAALEAALEIGSGVQAVRDATGFGHGDLKPSNAFIDGRGGIYLFDFALARSLHNEDHALTMLHASVAFMPPERIDNPESDTTDLYSLALLLIWMLTGKIPGRTSANPKRHEERHRPLIDSLYGIEGLPEGVGALLDNATAYEPGERPSMHDFLESLNTLAPLASGAGFRAWASPIVSALILEGDETPITDTGGPLSNRAVSTPIGSPQGHTPVGPRRTPRIVSSGHSIPAAQAIQAPVSTWAVASLGVGMMLLAAAITASILVR